MSKRKSLSQLVVEVSPPNNRKAAEELGERLDALEKPAAWARAVSGKEPKKKNGDAPK